MPRKDLKLLLALSFFLFVLLLAVPIFAFSSAYGLNLGQSLAVGIDFVGSRLQDLGLALRGLSRSNLTADLLNPQHLVGCAALASLLLAFRSARAAFLSDGKRARRVAASAAGLQLWLSGTLLLTVAVEPGLETAVRSQGRIASLSQKTSLAKLLMTARILWLKLLQLKVLCRKLLLSLRRWSILAAPPLRPMRRSR